MTDPQTPPDPEDTIDPADVVDPGEFPPAPQPQPEQGA